MATEKEIQQVGELVIALVRATSNLLDGNQTAAATHLARGLALAQALRQEMEWQVGTAEVDESEDFTKQFKHGHLMFKMENTGQNGDALRFGAYDNLDERVGEIRHQGEPGREGLVWYATTGQGMDFQRAEAPTIAAAAQMIVDHDGLRYGPGWRGN